VARASTARSPGSDPGIDGRFPSIASSSTSIATPESSPWRFDGKQHHWFADYDEGRTKILERLGVRVIRFSNAEICQDLNSVLVRIQAELHLPFD
jgi:hypothetical protein